MGSILSFVVKASVQPFWWYFVWAYEATTAICTTVFHNVRSSQAGCRPPNTILNGDKLRLRISTITSISNRAAHEYRFCLFVFVKLLQSIIRIRPPILHILFAIIRYYSPLFVNFAKTSRPTFISNDIGYIMWVLNLAFFAPYLLPMHCFPK